MIINWYGASCFKVQTPDFNLVVDPESNSQVGNRLKGDLTLHTESQVPFENKEAEILGPGEYNINGARIKGSLVEAESDSKKIKTAYVINLDDIRLGFLGDISTALSEEVLDALGQIDILFVPANSSLAMAYVKSLEPKIVIPFGDIKKFSSDLGQKAEPQDKLVIKKKELEGEEKVKLVVLSS